jgi:protein-tyrosine phosphatase
LGNICRSPTAEGVFQRLVQVAGLSDQVVIDSAGTAAYHAGERADRRSRSAAKKRGYELESIARQFQTRDFDRFDYVLALDQDNLRALRSKLPDAPPASCHVGLLRDFDPSASPGSEVPDPYYGGDRGFEEVLDQCERACQGLLQSIRERLSS